MSLSAVAADAGISTATLSRIETEKQSIDVTLLLDLARVLEVSPAEMLGVENNGHEDVENNLIAALAALPYQRRMHILAAANKRSRRRTPEHLQVQIDALMATLDLLRDELGELHRQASRRRR
jgi:transcriptional regulator with XRE-family HTH domain